MYVLTFGMGNNALEAVFRKCNLRHFCNIFQIRWQRLRDKSKKFAELLTMGSLWLSSIIFGFLFS